MPSSMPSFMAVKNRFLLCPLVDRTVTVSCKFSSGSLYGEQDGVNYCRGNQIFLSPSVSLSRRNVSTRVFETRTVTASELFSLLTCARTTIFTFLSIFSSLEMSGVKIWGTIRP